MQRLDPASLQPATPGIEVPGYVWDAPVVLPDGRLVVGSSDTVEATYFWLNILDFNARAVESVELQGTAPVDLGYSRTLDRVVLLTTSNDEQWVDLFDPVTMTLSDRPIYLGAPAEWWPQEWKLFDDGRKIAFYSTSGYDLDRVGEPPQVRVLDLETQILGDAVTVEGVVHGYTILLEEFIRYPDFPYGEVEPGVVFDANDARLFVAHADGEGLTKVDLLSGEVTVVSLQQQPSFWGRALSWLIPPAQAKGSEPSATISAWLNADHTRLFITGEANDAWRDSERRLHTTTEPLGVIVVDTESLAVVETLELPVSKGLATEQGLALTGTTNAQIWCDEECSPGKNEPDVEGEGEATGLYLIDPISLDIVDQMRPGVFYFYMYQYQDWIITEGETPDGWGYESIDTRTGQVGPPRLSLTGSWSLMVTEGGVFHVEYPLLDN